MAHNPARGLDVMTCSAVHRIFRKTSLAGSAALLISDNLDEILEIPDRVAVIHKGGLSAPLGSQMIPFASMILILVRISRRASYPRAPGRNYDGESFEEF